MHVVEGLYYNKNNRSRFGYKLLHDKPAIVYTYAILHVCSNIVASDKICIDEALQHAIKESIEVN